MHVTLTVKHARRDENLEQLFEKERERIVRRLARVPLDLVSLHCAVDLNPHRKEGYASLTLDLPDGQLNARGVGKNVLMALRQATEALLTELDRHRQDRRRNKRSRREFRTSLEQAVDASLDHAETKEETSEIIRDTLPELREFVGKELSRHRKVLPLIDTSHIEVEEVIEESILQALSRRSEKPSDVPLDRWLITCAYDVVVREEERQASANGYRSLDDEATQEEPFGDAEIDDPIQAWNPEGGEMVSFSDVLPSLTGRPPEDEANGRDLQRAVLQAIRHLPQDTRKVLSMVALQGMAEREAAMRLHLTEDAIRTAVARGRTAVRAELSSLGYDTR